MAHWLVKEEPSHYGFEDLVRDETTEWTGVHNALAQRHLRAMHVGDTGFFYHSGAVKAVVGTFRVASRPRLDSTDDRGAFKVRIRAGRRLPQPVSLEAIKADPAFRTLELVRISRLSVMPISQAHWTRILAMARA